MTNPKNGTVEGGERPQSSRRRPPTIDLEATEIAISTVLEVATDELSVERVSDAVHDAPKHLTVDDAGMNHPAAIMREDEVLAVIEDGDTKKKK